MDRFSQQFVVLVIWRFKTDHAVLVFIIHDTNVAAKLLFLLHPEHNQELDRF